MKSVRLSWMMLAILMLAARLHARAQTTAFLPEVDVNYKLKPDLRLLFQAKETIEGGDPPTAELGPSIEFYLKPWLKLKDITEFDLDDSKGRPLVFSIGYRYLPTPGEPPKNRLEPVLTASFPMKGSLLLSDRNRADLDWKSGELEWEYRNRVQFERNFAIRSYHLSPYASAEFFYKREYAKWSDTAIYAGCLLPIGRHVEINPYYEHQNNTSKAPNQQLNQFGLVLNLYF